MNISNKSDKIIHKEKVMNNHIQLYFFLFIHKWFKEKSAESRNCSNIINLKSNDLFISIEMVTVMI